MELTAQQKGNLLDIISSMIENETSGRIYLDFASGSKIRVSKREESEKLTFKDLPLVEQQIKQVN